MAHFETNKLHAPALILHPDPQVRDSLGLTLSLQGFAPVCVCETHAQLDQAIKDCKTGLALLQIGGIQGFQPEELLTFQRQHRDVVIVALLDSPQRELMADCFSQGAFDTLHYPYAAQDLWRCLTRLMHQPHRLSQSPRPRLQKGQLPFPCRSVVMKSCVRRARQLALEDEVIFIQGETGTPVQELAQFLHQESGRKGNLFVLDASHFSTSEQKIRLMGSAHRPGLLRNAKEGSLLLKDYSTLSLRLQKAILDFYQDEQGPKLILSSSQSPLEMLTDESISQESFNLMQEAMLLLPPLRSCPQDLDAFFDLYLEEAALFFGKKPDLHRNEILQQLRQISWERNHEELREQVFKVMKNFKRGILGAKHFQSQEPQLNAAEEAQALPPLQVSSRNLKEVKHQLIQQVMQDTNHNQTEAALLLGYTRQALNQYLRRHRMISA